MPDQRSGALDPVAHWSPAQRAWMRRALELAGRGRATVSPNPMVGCVLVADGVVVGEGWHERPGGPHAEVMALAAAGARARGATAYVTLEPCAHQGRTGPCTRALADAGVAAVIAAVPDEDPVAAGGAAALRADGIAVEIGLCAEEATRQNAVFIHSQRHRRPFVILKAAVSLDGRIAAADGTAQWLTGVAARGRAHELRAEVDAVAVGSGTVLADDPRLTARPEHGSRRQPLRVVLDARGRVPADARVFDGEAPTLWFVGEETSGSPVRSRGPCPGPQGTSRGQRPGPQAKSRGQRPGPQVRSQGQRPGPQVRSRGQRPGPQAKAERLAVPPGVRGGVDLQAVLDALWQRQVRSLLVEGGAGVATSFVAGGLVDRLVVHVAPLLLGHEGRFLIGDGPATLADATRWRLDSVERSGDDAILVLEPRRED